MQALGTFARTPVGLAPAPAPAPANTRSPLLLGTPRVTSCPTNLPTAPPPPLQYVTRTNATGGNPPSMTCSQAGNMSGIDYVATFTFWTC